MDSYVDVMLAVLSGAVGILLILLIVTMVQLRSVKNRYRRVIGNANVENVDELLIRLQEQIEGLSGKSKEQADTIQGIRQRISTMKSNVRIKRYNAFSQQGSDLSFSLAILDDQQDGVVLTGIHSREESYLYAKPIQQGNSSYTLSPEEKEVIALRDGK